MEEKSKRMIEYDEFDKFVKSFCESGFKIKESESTKLETDHGNETYSSIRIYFMYVYLILKRSDRYCLGAGVGDR